MMRWLDDVIDSRGSLSKLWETVKNRKAWHAAWGCKESDKTEELNENSSFLIATSSMGSKLCKILCVLCQSEIYFSQPFASPQNKLSGLQTQTFWGLIFQYKTPGLGRLMWDLDLMIFGGNLYH